MLILRRHSLWTATNVHHKIMVFFKRYIFHQYAVPKVYLGLNAQPETQIMKELFRNPCYSRGFGLSLNLHRCS